MVHPHSYVNILTNMKFVKTALVLVLALLPTYAHAAKLYRCQGKVQYRPCNQALITHSGRYNSPYRALQDSATRLARAQIKSQSSSISDDLYAEVVKSTFKKLTCSKKQCTDGQWRGVIRGNGTVHLTLQILRNGLPESTRYMGNIKLLNSETSFNFVSSSPSGKDWSWQVLALAR